MSSGYAERRWWESTLRRPVTALLLALVVLLLAGNVPPPLADAREQREPDRGQKSALVERFERGLAEMTAAERRGPNTQVVGGTRVDPGKFKFMAFVEIEIAPNRFAACGGSVIDATHVLTAAHCVTNEVGVPVAPDQVMVGVGGTDLTNFCGACVLEVAEIDVHPLWNPVTYQNDAAVLELGGPVPSKRAKPIKLVGSGVTKFDKTGRSAIVAGWGTTESGAATSPDQLRQATVKVVDDNECQVQYGAEFDRTVMICAAAPGKDSCQGDSGGPLFVKQVKGKRDNKRVTYTQIGIVSFGVGCANPNFAGVYTRLSAPTINQFIELSVSS